MIGFTLPSRYHDNSYFSTHFLFLSAGDQLCGDAPSRSDGGDSGVLPHCPCCSMFLHPWLWNSASLMFFDFICNLIFLHGHETSPFNYFTWLLNAKESQFVVAISLLLNSNCTFRWRSPSITTWIYRQRASVQVYSSAWSWICCEVWFTALTWKSLWHCPTVRFFGFLCAGYTLVLICWQIMASSMVGLMKRIMSHRLVSFWNLVMYRKQYPYGDLPCAVEMEIAGRKGSNQITTAAIQSTIASVKPGFCRLIRICRSVRSLIDKIRCEAM